MYYLFIETEDDDQPFPWVIDLMATDADAADAEAIEFLAQGEVDEEPWGADATITARIVCTNHEQTVSIAQAEQLAAAGKKARITQNEAWQTAYEKIRDELGHWRTMHERGQCPHAQVVLMEDRLKAHLAARPHRA